MDIRGLCYFVTLLCAAIAVFEALGPFVTVGILLARRWPQLQQQLGLPRVRPAAYLIGSCWLAWMLLFPNVGSGPVPPSLRDRMQLMRVATAAEAYMDQHGSWPEAGPGQPACSWRVALLPLLGEQQLYDRYRLDEPWDSPHNRELLTETPSCYEYSYSQRPGTTRMLAVRRPQNIDAHLGKTTIGEPDSADPDRSNRATPMRTSKSESHVPRPLVCESAKPIPWTKPDAGYTIDDGFTPLLQRPQPQDPASLLFVEPEYHYCAFGRNVVRWWAAGGRPILEYQAAKLAPPPTRQLRTDRLLAITGLVVLAFWPKRVW